MPNSGIWQIKQYDQRYFPRFRNIYWWSEIFSMSVGNYIFVAALHGVLHSPNTGHLIKSCSDWWHDRCLWSTVIRLEGVMILIIDDKTDNQKIVNIWITMNDFQFIFGTAGSILYIYHVLSIMADNAIWWCFPCAFTILRIKLVLNIDQLNFHYGISDETLEKCVIIWVKFFKLFYQKTLHIYVNTNIVSYSQCSLCRQCLCFFSPLA